MILGKRALILLILALVIGIFYLIKLFQPENTVEYYNSEIKQLTERLNHSNNEIKDYYQSQRKKYDPYGFLFGVKGTLKELFEENIEIREMLAETYRFKGDYFFDTTFLYDKKAPKEYIKYQKSFKDYTPERLKSDLKNQPARAEQAIKLMVKTRKLALENYQKATEVMSDKTTSLYVLVKDSPFLNPIPLRIGSGQDKLTQIFRDNEKIVSREKYFNICVNSRFHHKIARVHSQLAIYESYTRLNRDKLKQLIDMAELEYLIAWGAEYESHKVKFDLADLYIYRYQNLEGFNKEFQLQKAEMLLKLLMSKKKVQIVKLSGKKVNIQSIKQAPRWLQIKSLLLLGNIYYQMSGLDAEQYDNLRKIDFKFAGEKKNTKKIRLYLLELSKDIFKNRLLANLSENSAGFDEISSSLKQIETEIERLKREK